MRVSKLNEFLVLIAFACSTPLLNAQSVPVNEQRLQPPAPNAYTPHLAFDVASIRETKEPRMRYAEDVPGTGVWMARGVSVGTIISVAYDVKIMGRLKGLPNWTQTASYDVTAKADDATDAVLFKLSKDDFAAEKRYMLQQLLAERFHLRIRAETVQGTTYELRKTPRTATFITPVPDGKMISTCGPIFTPHKGVELHSKGCPFTYLVGDIQQDLRTEVVDATGMTGYFAYTLKWNLSSMPPPPPDEEWYPDMVHAVPEQLGLELVKTQGPITSWVVDSLERPTSN